MFYALYLYKHTVPTALNLHGIYRAVALTGLSVFCASVNPCLQPGLVYFAPSALERKQTRVSGNLVTTKANNAGSPMQDAGGHAE